MEAVAHASFQRFSYRKVGQVLKLIRGKSVAKAWADPGPIINRFQPKDRGKAYPIMKRTSHLIVEVDERAAKQAAK